MYGIIVGVFYSGLIGALFWARVRRRKNERVADEAYEDFKGENRGPSGRLVGREMRNDDSVELREMRQDASPAYVDEDHARPVEARALV